MSLRFIVEGEEGSVHRFVREIKQDRRYRFYHPHEFLLSPHEIKIEYYVERAPRRIFEQKKRVISEIVLETPEEHGSKEIKIELLDAKKVDLLDGKIRVIGKSYDPYSNPNSQE